MSLETDRSTMSAALHPDQRGPVPPGVPLPSAANCVATNISGNYDDIDSFAGWYIDDDTVTTP